MGPISRRLFVLPVLLSALAACHGKLEHCPPYQEFTQTTATQTFTLSNAVPVTIFGKGIPTAQLTGTLTLKGLNPNQQAEVQLVHADCTKTGCPTTLYISVAGQLLSSGGNGAPCGSVLTTADMDGAVVVQVDNTSSEGQDIGLLISPQ